MIQLVRIYTKVLSIRDLKNLLKNEGEIMSRHSYTKVWLHIIWGTLKRDKVILNKDSRIKISSYFYQYTKDKSVYMNINYVNSDHVHVLVDFPTNISLENLLQLLKGSSSHWINQKNIVPGKFAWARGYSIFSVSHYNIEKVKSYIANQHKHHREARLMP